MTPIYLSGNQFEHFYAGGGAIAAFRGIGSAQAKTPEDWIASTTTRYGHQRLGLSSLPDGRLLADAIAAEPLSWLGAEHRAAFGDSTELLVKLLDAGERLVVHCHPSREFATQHLGCAHGKTEAWLVLETSAQQTFVYLGFQTHVPQTKLRGWVTGQRTVELLSALNRVQVFPGDAILVPAGLPHAIGAGVFVAELQEPTDFSVLLEWKGFSIDGERDGHLGLGYPVALTAVDRSAWNPERLAGLHGPIDGGTARELVLPRAADPYFRAERLRAGAHCEASFAVLLVLEGEGQLRLDGETLAIRKGQTLVVPHAAGPTSIHGPVSVLRCLPPAMGSITPSVSKFVV
jgi:mannose-6-phosphate isomerase